MVAPAVPAAATVNVPSVPGTVGLDEELVNTGAPDSRARLKNWAVAPSPLVATRLNACTPGLFAVVAVPEITPELASSARPAGRAPLDSIARLSIAWLLSVAVVVAPKANCQFERSAAFTLPARFICSSWPPS